MQNTATAAEFRVGNSEYGVEPRGVEEFDSDYLRARESLLSRSGTRAKTQVRKFTVMRRTERTSFENSSA